MPSAQTIGVTSLVITLLGLAQLAESQQPKKEPVRPPGVASWKTPAGLWWTTRDNGRDVSYDQAHAYCAELTLDGFSDWRLPTDVELRTLYRPNDRPILLPHSPTGPYEVYIDKHITLERVSVWVDYEPAQEERHWAVAFTKGNNTNSLADLLTDVRALCVRSSV